MKKSITTLLEKPMDRKDFLRHAGVGAVMMMGGGLVVQALTNGGQRKRVAAAGYGSTTYGGSKRG